MSKLRASLLEQTSAYQVLRKTATIRECFFVIESPESFERVYDSKHLILECELAANSNSRRPHYGVFYPQRLNF